MPNYNNALYLDDCLNSIKAQYFSDFEVIIYDDCSNDNSVAIIKENIKDDERFHLIEGKVNKGVAFGYNYGIKHAQGKYIAFIDADNIMARDRLKNEFEYLEHHQDSTMVAGSWVSIDDAGVPSGYSSNYPYHDHHIKSQMLLSCAFNNAMTIRKEFFDITEIYYDETLKIAVDYDFFVRAMINHKMPVKFHMFKQAHLYYRIHDSNMSIDKTHLTRHQAERKRIADYILTYLGINIDDGPQYHALLFLLADRLFVERGVISLPFLTDIAEAEEILLKHSKKLYFISYDFIYYLFKINYRTSRQYYLSSYKGISRALMKIVAFTQSLARLIKNIIFY